MPFYVIIINSVVLTLVFLLLQRSRRCQACGARAPMGRTPTTLKLALWGGWTCAGCDRKLDSTGRAAAR